jgi:hypothetical protein
LSFGRADAVLVLSPSTPLADAAATTIGNVVRKVGDVPVAIELAQSIEGLKGVAVIKGDRIGLWGEVRIS